MEIDSRLSAIVDCLYRVSAKAIIINDRKLLLSAEPEGWYSLPGGGVDYGEKLVEGLERELHEEIEFNDCLFQIQPDVLFATNLEIDQGIPRVQLYFRVELSKPDVLAPKELNYLWASTTDLDTLTLSQSATEAKPHLLSLLASF